MARSIDIQELQSTMLVLADLHDSALATEDTDLAEAAEIVGDHIARWIVSLTRTEK